MTDQTETTLPLAGIRVIDVATIIAAPYCATILGEFGAEVLKVEHPIGGDPARHFGTPTNVGDTLCWLSEARNKKSVTIDLRSAQGAELFKALVAKTDVVCENFRPGTLEKWGLGWEVLREVNPRLIMLRVSGYGQTGPYMNRPDLRVSPMPSAASSISPACQKVRPLLPARRRWATTSPGCMAA